MKTIITYTIISFAGLFSLYFMPSNIESSQPLEITYGRGYFCTGKGICNISAAETSTPTSIQLISDREGNPLYIEIPKSSLTKEEAAYHFSDGSIKIDKKFLVSQSRSIENSSARNEIQSGVYPILSDDFSYRIPISPNKQSKE